MIVCNNCGLIFENNEESLEFMSDENGYFRGCPLCKTDAYLMDSETDEG